MSRTVLFAGGPLHGQVMTIDDHTLSVRALEATGAPIAIDSTGPLFREVCYAISRFTACGRIIQVGHLGARPDEDLVFEVLFSDDAKAVAVRVPAVRALLAP